MCLIQTHKQMQCAHVVYIIYALCKHKFSENILSTHLHVAVVLFCLFVFQNKLSRKSVLYSLMCYLFFSRAYKNNKNETGETLRLDVELAEPLDVELPPTSHANLRGTAGFEIILCPTSTQITRDVVSKHWTPCPSDYGIIRHYPVISSEVVWWPWAIKLELSLKETESKLKIREVSQWQTLGCGNSCERQHCKDTQLWCCFCIM